MSILDKFTEQCEDVRPLAEGGQKRVHSGVHPDYGQIVIKHGEYRYATTLERAAREVELLRELKSKYFPRHYEFLVDPLNREFLIVEERIEGTELSEVRDDFSDDDSILNLARHLVCALRSVWQRNVVHRDLKPANILITPGGEPRIIDFGIARFLDEASLTQTMAGVGPATPIYASPEQLRNRKSMINHRTDFFLIGLLLLELAHGFHPFDPVHVGNDSSVIDNILNGLFVPPTEDRDPRLVQLLAGMLAHQPYQRFRTVEEVFSLLQMSEEEC